MKSLKVFRKGIFPLRTLTININGKDYKLKGNGEIEVTLPEKKVEVVMKMDFWKSTQQVELKDDASKVVVEHKIPDMFFILGLLLLLVISTLTFLGMLPVIVLGVFLFAYMAVHTYYLFIKSDEYFRVRVI